MTTHESQIKLTLAKAASSSGGDKYKADLGRLASDDKARFVYIPQAMSRPSGNVSIPTLTMTIGSGSESDPSPGTVTFKLIKHAKGSGDNRYATDDKSWGDMYLPKGLPELITISIC